jgi:hypothetical protein
VRIRRLDEWYRPAVIVTRSEIETQVREFAAAEGEEVTASAGRAVEAAVTILVWAENRRKRTKARVRGDDEDVVAAMLGERASPLESPVTLLAHSRKSLMELTEGHNERPLVAYLLRPGGDMDPPLYYQLDGCDNLCWTSCLHADEDRQGR